MGTQPETRKAFHQTALVLALLLSALAGNHLVNAVKANGYIPEPTSQMTIGNPVNKTYYVNTTTLEFHVATSYWDLNFFYSLDGQDMKKVENLTTFTKEDLNAGKNPSVYLTTLKGTCVLGNLSEDLHNVTVYQISYVYGNPLNEQTVYSASTQFNIATLPEPEQTEPEVSFPVVPVAAAVAVGGAGLLVFHKKRKHRLKLENQNLNAASN